MTYSFICQFSLRYYWYCYNQKQSSVAVLQKRCSYRFSKIDKKTPKRDSGTDVFLWILWNFSNIFLKEPFGRLLHHKHSFSSLSHHDLSPFPKQCHTYFLPEYFFGLTCGLGTRVSSIFQALSQKPIFNPAEHLWWSFFGKIVNSLKKPLSIFGKNAPLRYSTRL